MLGWSITASACRSASKRAITWRVSMPGLMTLSATFRRTGAVCSAMKTTPKPPSPICWSLSQQLVGPHRFRGGRKEVPAAVPCLSPWHINQPQIGLMHQRGGLQRLPRILMSEPGRSQLPQLLVNQRE
jgi:hypothetical protein